MKALGAGIVLLLSGDALASPFQLIAGGPADGSNGMAIAAPVSARGLEAHGNRLWLADSDRNKIRFIQDGIVFTFTGNGVRDSSGIPDGTSALTAQLSGPQKVTVDVSVGDVYFTDNGKLYVVTESKVYRVRPNGTSFIASPLAIPGVLLFVDYNKIWGCPLPRTDGNWCTTPVKLAGTGSTPYNGDNMDAAVTNIMPTDLAYESLGTVLVTDGNSPTESRIRRFNLDGTMTVIKTGLSTPLAVAAAPNGDIYYAESAGHENRIVRLRSGSTTTILGTGEVITVPQQWCMTPPCEGTSYPFKASDLTISGNTLFATDQQAGLAAVSIEGNSTASTPTVTATRTQTPISTCKSTPTSQLNCE